MLSKQRISTNYFFLSHIGNSFVRNAFGNYFDILKEVTRHPLMSRMLTFVNGQSTGYAYIKDKYIQQADENYARCERIKFNY